MTPRVAAAIHELHDALTEYVKTRKRGEMNFEEAECMKIYRAVSRMLFWAKRNRD